MQKILATCTLVTLCAGGTTIDARKGQEKGKVDFQHPQTLNPPLQIVDIKRRFGRGEWIRTTRLLVPNQAVFPNTMITQRIFLQENSI